MELTANKILYSDWRIIVAMHENYCKRLRWMRGNVRNIKKLENFKDEYRFDYVVIGRSRLVRWLMEGHWWSQNRYMHELEIDEIIIPSLSVVLTIPMCKKLMYNVTSLIFIISVRYIVDSCVSRHERDVDRCSC